MFPEWKNSLLISALVPGDVRRIKIENTLSSKEEILFSDLGRVRDIEVSPDGSLILATDGQNGKLIRVIRGN
jgi:glucose/arabinose dehydrogenase